MFFIRLDSNFDTLQMASATCLGNRVERVQSGYARFVKCVRLYPISEAFGAQGRVRHAELHPEWLFPKANKAN